MYYFVLLNRNLNEAQAREANKRNIQLLRIHIL